MKRTLVTFGSLLLALGTPWVGAASDLVATDLAVVGLGPHLIDGMELYDNGLFWWHQGTGACAGEGENQSTIGIAGVRDPRAWSYYEVRDCQSVPAGVTRDDAHYYFTGSSPAGAGLYRLPTSYTPQPTGMAEAVGNRFSDNCGLKLGAVAANNGRIYFAVSHTGCSVRGSTIYYWQDVGGPVASQPIVLVAGAPGDGSMIKKIGFMSGLAITLPPIGICLDRLGHLYRFDSSVTQDKALVKIADNISDFAIRRSFIANRDILYASTGVAPFAGRGRFLSIDPDTALATLIHEYTPEGEEPDNMQYTAIGMDAHYVFLTQNRVECIPMVGCSLTTEAQIVSKYFPASTEGNPSNPVDSKYKVIEPVDGSNLRSDDKWLYFTSGREVRRRPNDSPPLRFDIAALGVEAVQVVQDELNSVRLVEGKRTIVRAYARLNVNNTGKDQWFPGAVLTGSLNGTPFDNPPVLYPKNRPAVPDIGVPYGLLRTPNLNYSFQFDLPDSWVRSGRLTLRFAVNPNLAIYESGPDPLANNTNESTISVVQVTPPCFVFTSIHNSAPNYWPWEQPSEFAAIMARAKAMLPVPDIQIVQTTERISDHEYFSTDPFDLTTDAGWQAALVELRCYHSLDFESPVKALRTYYVGAVHPATPNSFWGGLAPVPGRHFMALMNPIKGGSDYNSSFGGVTVAHEFGHNLGRPHVNCGGAKDPDPNYPYNNCSIGPTDLNDPTAPVGFDMISPSFITPSAAADLMSYGVTLWPSRYTYNAMLDALRPVGPASAQIAAAATPPPGPYFHISGVVDPARHHVSLSPCFTLANGVAPAAQIQASLDAAALPPPHDYRVRVLNNAGAILQETPLVLEVAEDLDRPSVTFVQYVPAPAGAAKLQIISGGAVLAECHASPNAPSVGPVQAIPDEATRTLAINYSASDPDRDPLHFTLQFSRDNGATWNVLRIHEGNLSYIASTRFLAGGSQCRIRVIVTDGFHSAVNVSAPFALNRHAPEAFIGGVREGQRLPYNPTDSLLGFALDAEDGSLPASTLSWVFQGPTPRTASGDALPLSGLSPGLYAATLSGRDSDNNGAAATVHFEILPLVVADGPALSVDGAPNDPAYATASAVTWPLDGKARATFVHANGYLYAAFTDLEYRGEPPQAAVVGLRVDVDGSGGSGAQTTDVGFFVDEQGIPFQMRGDGTTMQVSANPSPGFKAVITRGQSGWNAEFRIAESLLGGWNHAARLLLEHNYLMPDNAPLTVWPPTVGRDNPASWAQAWFGNMPPVSSNLPPIAKVEAMQNLNMNGPITVFLNGGASFDPEGSPLNYSWTQLAGPSVTLQNTASAAPSFFFAGSQTRVTFRFRLVVSDGSAVSAPVETRIILEPATAQNLSLKSSTTVHTDGSVTGQLIWAGANGDRVVVQASTDLRQWVNVATNTVDFLRVILFHDLQAGLYRHRFYRLADAPSGPICVDAPSGLVGWWRAEDDATDATGNNHGTLLGGLGFGSGKVGRALNFTSANQDLVVPASPTLDVGQLAGMTVEAWINPTDAVNEAPIAEWGDESGTGTHFWVNVNFGGVGGPGSLYASARFGDSSYFASPPGIVVPNVWQHVAFTYDQASGTQRLYHNGIEVASQVIGSLNPQTSFNLNLGHRFGGQSFRGRLDEVALYSRALSLAELREVYLVGSAGKCRAVCGTAFPALNQDFEIGSPVDYTLSQLVSSPAATVQNADSGSRGRFLRLLTDGVNDNVNAITFNQTASGQQQAVRAEFDFRLASGDAPADGFAFMLIPTSIYGTTGPGFITPIAFEEPNIPGVFAVGFDVHPRTERNDVSVHWNGTEYANVNISGMSDGSVNLTSGSFHRALVTLRHITGGALVTVSLVHDINSTLGTVYTPVRDLFIPALDPFSSRIEFAGRTGGLNMDVDLDNIVVQFLPFCLTGP